MATVRAAAGIAGLDLAAFLQAIAAEIERRTGTRPEVADAAPGLTRAQRLQELKPA